MTWDELRIHEWSQAYNPQPYILSASTIGCGCCADSETIRGAAEAIAVVREYIKERQEEIAEWEDWLKRMETSQEIVL